jgi:hypothetical protein
LGDGTDAAIAAAAVIAALGDSGATSVLGWDSFYIPFRLDARGNLNVAIDGDGEPGVDAVSGVAITADCVVTLAPFASFAPVAVVPVPEAVWLFGSALIGLVGFSKPKSRIAA